MKIIFFRLVCFFLRISYTFFGGGYIYIPSLCDQSALGCFFFKQNYMLQILTPSVSSPSATLHPPKINICTAISSYIYKSVFRSDDQSTRSNQIWKVAPRKMQEALSGFQSKPITERAIDIYHVCWSEERTDLLSG